MFEREIDLIKSLQSTHLTKEFLVDLKKKLKLGIDLNTQEITYKLFKQKKFLENEEVVREVISQYQENKFQKRQIRFIKFHVQKLELEVIKQSIWKITNFQKIKATLEEFDI